MCGFFFSLHPSSAFLDFFFTGVATLVILCGSVSWLWQQLALLSSGNYCPPTETVFRRWPVSSPSASPGGEPARPSQRDGEGKRRSGKGTDWRGSGTLGGGKFNKQGNRCLSSFSRSLEQLFTLHGEVCRTLRGPLLVGGFAVIDTFILFRDSFNKQRAASWS